eukprot:11924549-Alexandrium_andersonii.AAC.1
MDVGGDQRGHPVADDTGWWVAHLTAHRQCPQWRHAQGLLVDVPVRRQDPPDGSPIRRRWQPVPNQPCCCGRCEQDPLVPLGLAGVADEHLPAGLEPLGHGASRTSLRSSGTP